VERMLNMRFDGTDTSLMVLPTKEDGGEDDEDFKAAFVRAYKAEFGFLLDTKRIVVDDIKVMPSDQWGAPLISKRFIITLGSWYRQNVRQPRSVCICGSSPAQAKTCRPQDKTGDTPQCLL
jgi:N-methylhydantoinase A/oxoprolinase/acetone carboxylase beta subunit